MDELKLQMSSWALGLVFVFFFEQLLRFWSLLNLLMFVFCFSFFFESVEPLLFGATFVFWNRLNLF